MKTETKAALEGAFLSGENIAFDTELPDAKIDQELDAKLTAALQKKPGSSVHGFRSGGGLRVFRFEGENKLLGYGEHPHALEALSLMVQDLSFMGRAYKKVYGAMHPHYLTGSSEPQLNRKHGALDLWILQGNTFDASVKDGHVEVVLSGYSEYHGTQAILDQAKTQPEVPVRHENRGYVFETTYHYDEEAGPDRYPTGCVTRVVSCPKGKKEHRAWMWHSTQTGRADTVFTALEAAFAAPEIEVPDRD